MLLYDTSCVSCLTLNLHFTKRVFGHSGISPFLGGSHNDQMLLYKTSCVSCIVSHFDVRVHNESNHDCGCLMRSTSALTIAGVECAVLLQSGNEIPRFQARVVRPKTILYSRGGLANTHLYI